LSVGPSPFLLMMTSLVLKHRSPVDHRPSLELRRLDV
jgi:hypothetical protein